MNTNNVSYSLRSAAIFITSATCNHQKLQTELRAVLLEAVQFLFLAIVYNFLFSIK